MSKPAILQIGDITHCEKEWSELGSFAELKVSLSNLVLNFIRLTIIQEFKGSKMRADFLKEIENGSFNDVVALYRSNESTSVRLNLLSTLR